ncbi:hypothetical protein JCM8097_006490 [Rhodosporidiobolus ruineniae]
MDPSTGLPLAFGKKASTQNKHQPNLARLDQTRRKDTAAPTDTPNSLTASTPATSDNAPSPAQSAADAAAESTKASEIPRDRLEALAGEDDEGAGAQAGESQVDELPVSHEVVMKDHVKTVSALSLDPSGARLASGSYDYDVKLWDFGGMNAASFKPFRGFEARAGHQVTDVAWNASGSEFLVANGATQVKLYDRDGAEIGEFNKGDMYIRDLRNTDGHVAAITSLAWHPTNATTFLTCSSDSSLRIWSTTDRRKSKHVLIVRSKLPGRGGKTKLTSCCWSPEGKMVAATAEDGGLHVWRAGAGAKYLRPDWSNEKAHEEGSWTGGVAWSPDGRYLVTRGGDGTVKLWNPKSLKTPLHTASSLPSLNQETNIIFSPSGRYILTGTAGSKAGVVQGTSAADEAGNGIREGGKVVVFETEGLRKVREIEVSEYSVVRVLWHPKINQIITGSADGSIHVLYSPLLSTKGALLSVTRPVRRPQIDDYTTSASELDRPIIAPHSLPMFKDEGQVSAGGRGGKRKREKERMDPQKTMKPLPPVTGPGKGGRIGAAATQHVVQGLVRNTLRDVDPREALLKYATSDPSENTWTQAWAKTQPKAVFDPHAQEEEEAEERAREAKKGKR